MREPNSPPLAMSHSPAYYQHYRSSNNSSPTGRHSHPPRRPPPAHVAPRQEPLAESDHLKTSISSATSGSTDATDPRYQQSSPTYQYNGDAERGHGLGGRSCQSQFSPATSQRHGHREMVQAPPATVVRYIRQDADDDEEEEEAPDHAIWILVSHLHLPLCPPTAC